MNINLKGIIVGNGCTDPSECSMINGINYYYYDYLGKMGFY